MKSTFDIPVENLDNEALFESDFFKRFTQQSRKFELAADRTKEYFFPTFYGNVTCAQAIMFADKDALREAVEKQLGRGAEPVSGLGGRGIIAFSCYEYRQVKGVRPYNEIAVAVPIVVNRKAPPLLPLVKNDYPHFGYCILSMPVTSEENTRRGRVIWNLPKETMDIDIDVTDDECITTCFNPDGSKAMSLKVPVNGSKTVMDQTGYLFTSMNGTMERSRTALRGDFAVNKNAGALLSSRGGTSPLELGEGRLADELRGLDIHPAAFQFRFATGMDSCFDLPDNPAPSWVRG